MFVEVNYYLIMRFIVNSLGSVGDCYFDNSVMENFKIY